MEILHNLVDFIIHLDHHLSALVANYGLWSYTILFLIIFCETGLVVTPFLPGDSLLFVLGALAAQGALSLPVLIVSLLTASVLGNMLNYAIGSLLAKRVTKNQSIPFVKQAHIQKTQAFFDKYGAKTIIITRFIPIIRTFAPFMAGVGHMPYAKFSLYNFVGGSLWVLVGILSGYFFGNLSFVQKNFSVVILAIVVISLIPAVLEFFKHKKDS